MFATLVLAVVASGAEPVGGVTPLRGVLYGATRSGGLECEQSSRSGAERTGCGVIYRINQDGSDYTVIHRFSGTDGRFPIGTLEIGPDGRIYGRTRGGGKTNNGVIYSLNVDGSGFTVLADPAPPPPDETPLAIDASDTVYAIIATADGTPQLMTISKAHAVQVAMTFPARTVVNDLRPLGNGVFTLSFAAQSCGSEIRRFGPDSAGRMVFSSSAALGSAACRNALWLQSIVPVDRFTQYGLEWNRLYRIHEGRAVLVATIPEVGGAIGGGQPMPLSRTPDGRFTIAFTRDGTLNCLSVISLKNSSDIRTIALVGADSTIGPGCAPFDRNLAVMVDGSVFGTAGDLPCPNGASHGPSCGEVFALLNGRARVLRRFDSPMAEVRATPHPIWLYQGLETAGDGRTFLLTRHSEAVGGIIAATPSPMPITMKSETTGRSYSLSLVGRTQTRPLFAPYGFEIPALAYRSPDVPAGMYDFNVGVNEFYSRAYIPELRHAPTQLRPGQQFLAIPTDESALLPMTDTNGRSFGTTPLVFISRKSGTSYFRAGDTTIALPIPLRSPAVVPGLKAIGEDDVVRALRRAYDGRTAYARQLSVMCMTAYGSPIRLGIPAGNPVRVQTFYRVLDSAAALSFDGSGLDQVSFAAIDPLVVVLAPPFPKPPAILSEGRGDCVAAFTLAADPWHLARIISLEPRVDPSWPEAFRTAVERGDVIPGMTRAMVAASIGYPTHYGTPEDFDKIDDWKYDAPAPGGQEVLFAAGKVVKYVPASILP